jgi:hypothetical protein
MPGINSLNWNLDLPDSFLIYGSQSLSGLDDPGGRSLIIQKSGGGSRVLAAETELIDFGGSFRVYPRFLTSGVAAADPDLFPLPPRIVSFSGEMLSIQYQPLEGILSEALYWVPESEVICGELKLTNIAGKQKKLTLEMVFQLQKSAPGAGLNLLEYEGKNLLHAVGAGQHLVCFLSGGAFPLSGADPGLGLELILENKTSQNLRWIIILASSRGSALKRLREIILLSWKGEISRRKITLQNRLKISTGDPGRDFALAYSQRQGENLLQRLEQITGGNRLQSVSPLDGLLLFDALYPLDQKNLQKLIDLVFPTQDSEEHGFPLLTGLNLSQRTYPLLGEFAGRLQDHYHLGDQLILMINRCWSALASWFLDEGDQDQDGIPEIHSRFFFDLLETQPAGGPHPDHPRQINPYLESPGLSALLLNEINRLKELQACCDGKSNIPNLEDYRDNLDDHINSSWDDQEKSFLIRDSGSHLVTEHQLLLEKFPPGLCILRKNLPLPSRIGLIISGDTLLQASNEIRLVIHGRDQDGSQRIEGIPASEILWGERYGQFYSKLIYTSLDYLYFQAPKSMTIDLICPGTSRQDISLFFPLLVGAPASNQTETLIKETITNPEKFWTAYGIRTFLEADQTEIQLPWNFLLVEAFLRNGLPGLAADLFSRLMNGMAGNIRSSGLMRPGLDSRSGAGLGPALSPGGLIPLRQLLEIAGIRLEKQQVLVVEGEYPFDFPLTIHYRGIMVERNKDQTLIQIAGEGDIILAGSQELRIPLA